MYDFERETLREGWDNWLIVNVGDYDAPEYRIKEPRKLLRVLYHRWEKAPEVLRDEWFIERILPRAQADLMRGIVGYGTGSVSDAVLARLDELIDDLAGRAVLCDCEDMESEP